MPPAIPLTNWTPELGYHLQVGLAFPTRDEGSQFIQDYAMLQHKALRVDPKGSGGRSRTSVCKDPQCPFFVQLCERNSREDHRWYVSSFHEEHDASCTSTARVTYRYHYTGPVGPPAGEWAINDQIQFFRAMGFN